jgi:hypothetical protein
MKYLYLLLILVLLRPFYSSAQSNYKSGYIVTLKGDTINGFVNYKEWDRNPKKIIFKESRESEKKEYSCKNIKAFTIKGYESFKREIIGISQDEVETSRLVASIDSTKIIDTVFLRLIATGNKVCLYSYTDQIKQRFYIDNHGQVDELTYHIYINPIDGISIVTQNTYKIQLQKLAIEYNAGSVDLIDDIQNAVYKNYSLSKIINKINGNINAPRISQRDGSRFFIGIGVNSSSVNIEGDNELSNAKSATSVFPEIKIGADYYLNKNVGTVIFRTELYFTGSKTQFQYSYVGGSSITQIQQFLKYNAYNIGLEPQIVYNIYNADNLKVYLDVGIAINYYKSYNETTTYIPSGTSSTSPVSFPITSPFLFDIPVKIGLVLGKKFDVYAGYVPKSTLNQDNYTLNIKHYEAGINYLF